MARIITWLIRLFTALALLAAVAAGLAYYLASRSLPDYDGTWRVTGISAPFEIVRDTHAVPHILATEDADAFFGLGFVHAQDRLWQMTLLRRTVQGRLSELFGADTLGIDELMRALDLYTLAQAALPHQTPETMAALEAYAAGVNAWLRVVQEEALGRGAPEFFLFDARIAPWVPADSLAVQKLIALQLTDKAAMSAVRAHLSLRLPPDRLRDILPDAVSAPVLALPDYAALFPGAAFRTADVAPRLRHSLDPVPEAGLAGASNAFAAAARRSVGGGALLAGDPHLPLTAPSIWMLARMDLAEGPVIGGTIPGIPAVLQGRNADLGWALTSSYLDDQDILIERLDPEDPTRYLTPGGWRSFRTREIEIGISGGEPERRTLRWSGHGPVIPGEHFGAAAITPQGHVATLAWTALAEEDRSVAAAIALMRARNIREGREATRLHLAPALMVTLADRSGVAIQLAGAQPARQPNHTSQGRLPAPGWLAANAWDGFLPFEDNPRVLSPAGGIVAHTNDPVSDGPFPRHVSFDWGDAHRILRAERLLNAREHHTLQSFVDIQTDAVSEAARILLPLIARDLWFGEPAEAGTPERRRQVALEMLADWNGEMATHRPEPLIYKAWIRALQRRLAVDRLGPDVSLVARPNPVFLERVFRDVDGAGAWCDVVQTSRVETCTEMARLALDDALVELEEAHGPRMEAWRWGAAHQAVQRHQTLGTVPILRTLVNIRGETPGGDNTLNRGQIAVTGPEPFANVHGAGLRIALDFADPDASLMIISTGQSGHLLSRHYDGLAGPWRRGEYIPMSLDPDFARAGAVGITRIEPRGAF